MRFPFPRGRRWRIVAALAGAAAAACLAARLWPYPELEAFRARPYGAEYLDRNGTLLGVSLVADGVDRRVVPSGLPADVVDRFLEAEDRRFRFHPGVDPIALVRAALQAASSGGVVSGASTIDMQLARMIRPRPRSFAGKLREMADALRLDLRLKKSEILALYLSNVPYGRGAEGVEAAAFAYFGKRAAALTAYEAGVLAVLPRAPARLDPEKGADALAETAARAFRRGPLGRGAAAGELRAAFAACAAASVRGRLPNAAPHFIRDAVVPALAPGASGPVRTTLDGAVQAALEAAVREAVEGWRDARLTNGAGIVLDSRTGEILAWMGSADFSNREDRGQMDGVIAPAQPGSCLKPFLYALALDRGFTPATVLPDVPLEFGSSAVYIPLNFNKRYNGPVRLRVALASSLNVPAVYVLNRLGVQNFADYLISLGFDSLAEQRDSVGVGLALGNADVTLLELARGFSVFLREGRPLDVVALMPEGGGPGAAQAETESDRAMSAYAADTIRSILSDPASRFVGFGEGAAFDVPFDAIFKTGTANQYQHVWALGAAGDRVVGIWMGNFLGETIIGRTGSGIPARAAARVLSALVAPGTRFPPPASVGAETRVCTLSGLAATDDCPASVIERFRDGEAPGPCSWHLRSSAGVRTAFPPEYAPWLAAGGRTGYAAAAGAPPSIDRPSSGAVFWYDPARPESDQRIVVQVSSWTSSARLLHDGRDLGPSPGGRFLLPVSRGRHVLELLQGGAVLERVPYTVR
jgi:penicillin-binding protein 1C